MTEPTSTAGVAAIGAAAGAIPIPFLASLGLDVHALIFGLIGSVAVQCLLPEAGRTARSIAMLTLGGTLLAGVSTPFAVAILVDYASHVPLQPLHNVTAAFIGGFAQPLLALVKAAAFKLLAKRLGVQQPEV